MFEEIIDKLFFINLALAFCALVEMTSSIMMTRKTSCMQTAGYTTVALYTIGLVAFVVQLCMRVYGHVYSSYAVLAALGILISGFIVAGIYRILLGRKSNIVLCIVSGALAPMPPVGTVFTVILLFTIRFDTRTETIVYNGFAYTFGALENITALCQPKFIDGGGEDSFETLDKKSRKALLRNLKKSARDAKGQFDYGAALMYYYPSETDKAVKYIIKAAKDGYPPALFNLGYFYEKGISVKKDEKRAHELYSRAAESGDGDAALRLGIVDIANGNTAAGVSVFRERAEKGDACAKFDLGVCYERGIEEKNIDKAVDMYYRCINMIEAQRRIFSLAADCVRPPNEKAETPGLAFESVVREVEGGDFPIMLKGLVALHEKRAADAADLFLSAVKMRGKWEGVARCLVGTLYIDCGALAADRRNGAAYVKSAIGLTPVAREIYAAISRTIIKKGGKGRLEKQ